MFTARYTLRRIPVEPSETKLLPRAERRASILRGAAAAFAQSGFAHTSMEDVGAACGVTKLIVYRHFGTKEELYRAILQQVFDRLGDELRDRLTHRPERGVGVHTQITVAREDPDGYRLLWRHAAREPMFAAYAASTRAISVDVTRQLLQLDSGDETLDQWTAEVLFTWLVESTLAWLDTGDPTRDDVFIDRTVKGFWALHQAWAP